MVNADDKAGPVAYLVAYVLLILFGIIISILGIGLTGDFLRIGLKSEPLENTSYILLAFSSGLGFIYHGLVKILQIITIEKNKKAFFFQPWFHSGHYQGFTATISPLKSVIYTFFTTSALSASSVLTWLSRESYMISSFKGLFSDDGLLTICALLLFLGTFFSLIFCVFSIINFAKFGAAEIELSQMPLTPGSEFTIQAKVSSKIPPKCTAKFELVCNHRYNLNKIDKSESDFRSEVLPIAVSEASIQKAKMIGDRWYVETTIKIPEDAFPTDISNPDNMYECKFRISFDFAYELVFPAPVHKVRQTSEIKFNPKFTRKPAPANA